MQIQLGNNVVEDRYMQIQIPVLSFTSCWSLISYFSELHFLYLYLDTGIPALHSYKIKR